jgi:molybdenum cofactor cytidylyltransferase
VTTVVRTKPLAGVILAAGASQRMGRPKAGLRFEGKTFFARVLEGLTAASLDPIVAVVGPRQPALVRALGSPTTLVNRDPSRGQLSSLKLALRYLSAPGHAVAGVVVALVDHPVVARSSVAALVQAAQAAEQPILVPTYRGRRGHPVVFMREVWDELLATPDHLGARAVVRRAPRRVCDISVDDPGILVDVDTPADLEALLSRAAPASSTRPRRGGRGGG